MRQESGGLEWLAQGRRQQVCCRGKQRETYNTPGQSRQVAEGAGAANRAAAMGGVALDAKARWKLAEAAVSGASARSARQDERSQYVDGLHDGIGNCAGWAGGWTELHPDPRRPGRGDRSRSLPLHHYQLDRRVGAELSAGRRSYLSRGDTERRRRPHLGHR